MSGRSGESRGPIDWLWTSKAGEPARTKGRSLPAAATLGVLGGLTLACLLVGSGPSTAAVAFAGAWVVVGAFLSAEIGVGLIILAVALFQREELFSISLPLWGGGLKPTDLLLLATLSGWALRQLLRREGVVRLPRHAAALVVAFVCWAVACAVIGIVRGYGYKASLLELRPLLQYALFLPIASEFEAVCVRRLVSIIKTAAFVVGAWAIVLCLAGKGSFTTYAGDVRRIATVNFVVLLVAFLLAAVALAGNRRGRIASAVVGTVSLVALAVTFQRAAFVGLGLALAVALWLLPRGERSRFFGIAAVLVFAAAATLSVVGARAAAGGDTLAAVGSRLASVLDFREDDSAQHRAAEWSAASAMIAAHPIVGNGLGAKVEFYSPMYDPERQRRGYWSDDIYVHNSYVWLLTKTGIIGLLLFAIMMGIGLAKATAEVDRASSSATRHQMIGLIGGWIALLAVSAFGPMVTTDDTVPFMVFILGAPFVHAAQGEGRDGREP